jgi:hypothetical protein
MKTIENVADAIGQIAQTTKIINSEGEALAAAALSGRPDLMRQRAA